MPGHRIEDRKATKETLERLMALVEDHDVLFLLTDSRESRWLPTVLGAAAGKLVINIALGFDSFVIMRHGTPQNGLGCYFCPDVNQLTDTLSHRTLDQQCSVTRAGLSMAASGMGVELAVSILQHPLKYDAPSGNVPDAITPLPEEASSILGILPHQIRGFLKSFSLMQLTGEAFRYCSACSPPVLRTAREEGADFFLSVFLDPELLSKVSGLNGFNRRSCGPKTEEGNDNNDDHVMSEYDDDELESEIIDID